MGRELGLCLWWWKGLGEGGGDIAGKLWERTVDGVGPGTAGGAGPEAQQVRLRLGEVHTDGQLP